MTGAAISRPQRAFGVGRLTAKLFDGRTRLAGLFQEGSAKIRLPQTFSPEMEAGIINTSGGLTGGEEMAWGVTAGAGCHVTATTQACEKIYKASAGTAEVTTRIAVAAGARVDWLPQETILFDRAALARRLEVDLDEGAEFLGLEAVLLGRRAMGEAMHNGFFADRWRIRRAGRLIHAEDIRLDGAVASLSAAPGVLSGRVAFATMLYCGPRAEAFLAAIRAGMGEAFGGASVWNDKLMVRLAAQDGFALRKTLIPLISILRNGAPVPKVWNI